MVADCKPVPTRSMSGDLKLACSIQPQAGDPVKVGEVSCAEGEVMMKG